MFLGARMVVPTKNRGRNPSFYAEKDGAQEIQVPATLLATTPSYGFFFQHSSRSHLGAFLFLCASFHRENISATASVRKQNQGCTLKISVLRLEAEVSGKWTGTHAWDFHNLRLFGVWILCTVCLPALPVVPTPAGCASRGPAVEVGGQAGYTHKMGSVSWLNQGEMFIPHLWASNEFRFKPHRPRNRQF